MTTRQKIIVIGFILFVIAAAGILALFWARSQNTSITTFQECVEQGFTTTNSDPRKCTGPDGKVYIEQNAKNDPTQPPSTSPPTVENNARQPVSLLVYFSKNPESMDDFTYTRAVTRSSDRIDIGSYTVEQLIAGPTDTEAKDGLFSPLKNTLQGDSNCSNKDFRLSVSQRIARLQFCRTVTSAGIGDDARIINTASNTLKQFSSVDSVIILTKDGDCFGDQSGQNQCLQ